MLTIALFSQTHRFVVLVLFLKESCILEFLLCETEKKSTEDFT